MRLCCPKCARFINPDTLRCVSHGEGYSHSYGAEATCSRCGPVELDWDLAFGDWDPEAELAAATESAL